MVDSFVKTICETSSSFGSISMKTLNLFWLVTIWLFHWHFIFALSVITFMIQVFSNLVRLLIKVSLMKLFKFWTNVCLAYEYYTKWSVYCLLKLINKVFSIGMNNIRYEFALITSACYHVFIYLLCIRFTILLVGITADLCGSSFSLNFFVYTSFFSVFHVTITAKRNYILFIFAPLERGAKPQAETGSARFVCREIQYFPSAFLFYVMNGWPSFSNTRTAV